jgi:large subunit ribosomal protein L17
MRHAVRSQRLSRPRDQRDAILKQLVRDLVVRGTITTTHARAKEAQRLADRLVTLGKDGSIHARRSAFRVLQDHALVQRLFREIAPRFVDCPGGYTRAVRLSTRRGDGAVRSLLAFSRLPVEQPVPGGAPKAARPKGPSTPTPPAPQPAAAPKKPKPLFEGLRSFWTRKRGQRGS